MKKRILALLLTLALASVPALASEPDAQDAADETPVLTQMGPVKPADESAPETAEPVADSAEPAEPVTDSAEPAPENAEPVADSAEPAEPVTDSAEPAIETPFSDVNADSPFLPGILYAVEHGITNGTTSTTFSPYVPCTHAQILTFLWRACGSPAPTVENPFADLQPEAYYYKAALWSFEKGLVDAAFDPYAACTRLQAVTYLWRLAGLPAAYEAHQADFPFTDVPDDSDARNAVAWASMEQSITNGTTETTFSPDKRCTRAQIVTFLYRGRAVLENA